MIAPFSAGVTRLSGQTRYDTAIAVSQRYSPGVAAAFVATGADFPDALSAAAAAAELGGPLLLTQPNQLPAAVGAELTRLQPQHIYVVGGTGVISAGVATALSHIASTERLAGADRYATADAIIRTAFAHTDHAIIATDARSPTPSPQPVRQAPGTRRSCLSTARRSTVTEDAVLEPTVGDRGHHDQYRRRRHPSFLPASRRSSRRPA